LSGAVGIIVRFRATANIETLTSISYLEIRQRASICHPNNSIQLNNLDIAFDTRPIELDDDTNQTIALIASLLSFLILVVGSRC
jgi:hypothetical protein